MDPVLKMLKMWTVNGGFYTWEQGQTTKAACPPNATATCILYLDEQKYLASYYSFVSVYTKNLVSCS